MSLAWLVVGFVVSIVRHLFANFLKEANNNEDEHIRSMNADCNFT